MFNCFKKILAGGNKQSLNSCFCSLIMAFLLGAGVINIARADVCFLPDGASCAQGDTEGFWPCVGNDCPSPDGKCDASYNSNKSTNECGTACTRCSDSSSPYNGLYKCPENTCNCKEYTSTNSYNECNQSCKVCQIAGDKNYGKYKCPSVPATGCPNPCKDCTLTEAQARAKMAADPCMECEQCSNMNCTDAQRSKWRCSENKLCKQCRTRGYNKDKNSSEYITSQQTCSRMQCEECPYNDISEGIEWYKCSECGSEYTQNYHNITDPQDKVNHCYENQTCGCYMKCDSCFGYDYTMQDCKNAGYDNAKNPCPTVGKRGTVYETCCNTCNGYKYSTDLSKTSEGWSCTPCNNYCSGGTKYSCGCRTGYHDNGNGGCASDCAVVTCGTAITSKPSNSHYTTCTSRTTTCAETTINTGWECDSGYHRNSAGNGCDKNCAVVICGTAITSKPSNSHYTTCTSRTTTCAETTINTGWECDSGYHKNSAGTACVNVGSCPSGYERKNPNVSEEDFIADWTHDNHDDFAQDCDPAEHSQTGCPYRLQYGTPLSDGTQCVKVVTCPSGYEIKNPNVSEEDFIFDWTWDNDRYHAQDCDPDGPGTQWCPYKLQYGTPLPDGTQCVKVVEASDEPGDEPEQLYTMKSNGCISDTVISTGNCSIEVKYKLFRHHQSTHGNCSNDGTSEAGSYSKTIAANSEQDLGFVCILESGRCDECNCFDEWDEVRIQSVKKLSCN